MIRYVCSLAFHSSSACGAGEQQKVEPPGLKPPTRFSNRDPPLLNKQNCLIDLSNHVEESKTTRSHFCLGWRWDYITARCHSRLAIALVANTMSYRGGYCCFGGILLQCVGFASKEDGDNQKPVGKHSYYC